MAVQASAIVGSPIVLRRSVDFPPTVWGNHFDTFGYRKLKLERPWEQDVEKLKEEVKTMLMAPVESLMQKLDLVDLIQRLGVSDHFESEIGKLLEQIFVDYVHSKNGDTGDNPHVNFLLFRLLRQQGLHISCDIINKCKDSERNFKAEIAEDPLGLLSLYEAANYSLHGEDIVDQALVFSRERLEAMAGMLSPKVAEEVQHALIYPLRRWSPRLEARCFMSIYEENPAHNKTLLALAKLDFNTLQKLHQEEVGEVTRWWKDVNLSMTQLTSVMDDIYDLYGTYEEIQQLTDAIERWDMSIKNNLPKYLQVYFETLLNLYVDIERELGIDGESFRMKCAREAMKRHAKAYFGEAKWFHERMTPTIDEYYKFALTTSCYPLFVTSAYLCMGDVVPNEAFKWIMGNPKILQAANVIGWLMNDLVSNEFEQGRGHSASSVESYIKQYNVSREFARDSLKKRVEDAWKDINECSMRPLEFPMSVLSPIINYTRASHVNYAEGDGYTFMAGSTKRYITSLFVDPVSL